MAETIQMNLNILPITKQRVEDIARKTYRGKGDVIDWLVAESYERIMSQPDTVSVETLPEVTTAKQS